MFSVWSDDRVDDGGLGGNYQSLSPVRTFLAAARSPRPPQPAVRFPPRTTRHAVPYACAVQTVIVGRDAESATDGHKIDNRGAVLERADLHPFPVRLPPLSASRTQHPAHTAGSTPITSAQDLQTERKDRQGSTRCERDRRVRSELTAVLCGGRMCPQLEGGWLRRGETRGKARYVRFPGVVGPSSAPITPHCASSLTASKLGRRTDSCIR